MDATVLALVALLLAGLLPVVAVDDVLEVPEAPAVALIAVPPPDSPAVAPAVAPSAVAPAVAVPAVAAPPAPAAADPAALLVTLVFATAFELPLESPQPVISSAVAADAATQRAN